ncbi:vomeronasal 1 receptor ornAnaV1R3105 [Ornithorhynchus anatinus]|uniref:Vomeronasal type-1 receptor n=1 Tax=Ornithorhynchus anatinus TaxID=9258 RepID=A0A6I8NX09_ORNAN|nr:vomeronasal 1 receptor ornAnaV1R3105 [Ornithorhynchus anatinus]
MNAIEISFGIVFLLQITLGITVNVFLLLHYTHMISSSPRFSSSDLILIHLALANTIILLTSGIPEAMSAWGQRNFLNDVGCKILNYLYRVARGLAICTTCLLSIFQAITISPGTSPWARVKTKLPQCILPCCVLSWMLNMLIEFDTLMNMTGPQNSSHAQVMLDLKYCTKVSLGAEINLIIVVLFSLRDLFFVGFMSLASGYMVLVLFRHHKRVQHLHGPSLTHREMPEVRAVKRVIALVTLYVLLYGRQTVMLSILINMKEKSPLLLKCHVVLGFTFSAMSPFLMIHSDRRMRTFWKKKSPASNMDTP